MSDKALLAIIRASRPTFRSRQDKVAYAVHSAVLMNGYRLVGVASGCTDEAPPPQAPEVPVDGWNSQEGEYSFKYAAEEEGASGLLVKAVAVDQQLLVSFLSFGDLEHPHTLELDTTHYTTDAQEVGAAFTHLDDLAAKVQSVLGGPPTKAAAAASSSQQQASTTTAADRRSPLDDPLRDPAFQPSRDPYPNPIHDPLLVGGGDLDPLGLGRPGRFGGGVPGMPVGGGMQVGPEHPFFRDHLRQPAIRPGMTPPGLPPGARWDPIRPPGMEGFNPEDFQRQPGTRRIDPDIAPRPPGTTDWDAMFG